MRTILRSLFAAGVLVLGAQHALAQPVNGCPAGQAMQSSDPSGRKLTCVPVPDAASITSAIAAEAAARASADQALGARIDALAPAASDIIGKWAVTGSTHCLQSSSGFDPNLFSPIVPTAGTTFVSQLSGTFLGTRTFFAGGAGRSVGTTHSITFPGTVLGAGVPAAPAGTGGASIATLDAAFTWSIQGNGTLLIDDDNTIPQPFTAPPGRLGWTATITGVPSYVGYISNDKRTIVMTHSGMAVETSVVRNGSGVVQSTNPRFCARSRVLTRLP